ncbi:DUF1990 family protein [Arachidicoccus terrestris]|uniref:DUF1990 family protein n=1 Tax=Arachidicoccus terrestris TaxID=2875539 RepID=UPI001CC40F53|nr:DUF1990 family protein [Arachidicoccus terrestris]UAY55607.1 DUF1990 domain-containing protein [Arachidicoccus terrestris]
MKIYIRDQQKKLKSHLDYLKNKDVMPYDKNHLNEKTSTINLVTSSHIENLDIRFLFNYKIFPVNIMSFKTQWQEEGREMRVGDTIVQQVYIPPIKKISQKLIFGVRISEIFNLPFKKGFSYETLAGHVERGVSSFTIETISQERLIFKIHTYSKPSTILTKLFGTTLSIPYQTFCTKTALKNVKKQVESNLQPD